MSEEIPHYAECSECAAKPGAPLLCKSCLHNRDTISRLKREIVAKRDTLRLIGQRVGSEEGAPVLPAVERKLADLRAMVDAKIDRVAAQRKDEVDAVFVRTPRSLSLKTVGLLSERLHENLGEDVLIVLLEGDADVEALNEETMRKRGWVRSRISFPEYPREIVCEGCENVVAFGPASLQDDTPIIASKLIRPNGKQPRDRDPLCMNCGESRMGIFRLTGGGPFTVRDRSRACQMCWGSGTDAPAKDRRCLSCNGSGRTPGTTGRQTCSTCKGTGADDGHVDDGAPNPPDCPTCNGDGKVDAGGFHTVQDCSTCGGRGRLAAQADRDAMVPPCPTCHGTGKDPENVDTSHCPTCKGTGKIPKEGPSDGPTNEH